MAGLICDSPLPFSPSLSVVLFFLFLFPCFLSPCDEEQRTVLASPFEFGSGFFLCVWLAFSWFFLCFSGFFLPCFCLRSSLPASVFFPGSWPVRPSLFSGFFLWVLLEFFPLVFGPIPPVFFSGSWPPPPVLFLPLPFIRPESFKNRLLHDRDRGRRHGHDGFDFVADFPASLLNRSSTSR